MIFLLLIVFAYDMYVSHAAWQHNTCVRPAYKVNGESQAWTHSLIYSELLKLIVLWWLVVLFYLGHTPSTNPWMAFHDYWLT